MAIVFGLNDAGRRSLVLATSATLALLSGAALAGPAINGATGGDSVAFQRQMQCQIKLADEAWERRIWPESNPTPKPPRQASQPDDSIRERVEDLLRKEKALADIYGVRLDAPALQAEIDRMATNTRDPERLRAQFALLGDDPEAIANCIARPLLIDRRLRDAYAADRRWHAPLEQEARAAMHAGAGKAAMLASGGVETLAKLVSIDRGGSPDAHREPDALTLTAEEFDDMRMRLSAPPGLRETADAFVEQTLMSATEDTLVVRSRVWAKQPFDAWWASIRDAQSPALAWRDFRSLDRPEIRGKAGSAPEAMSATEVWRLGSGAAPSARYYHSAVWTGSEMIVWGGAASSGQVVASGGRYNPTTDSWTRTTALSAPSPRFAHTAVWTGSEMLVWGGASDASTGVGTGGRYSPASDSWMATTLAGAPSSRFWHTAVWTGGEMIIWGGTLAGAAGLNTGARYNPTNNSWTPVSSSGAVPSARFLHTAVWTGTIMVVWGGTTDAASGSSTGARYNPLTDSWAATAPSGAPMSRFWHTAVWTGGEMIVWGGTAAPGQFLQSGGRYHPESNTWTTVTTASAPSERNAPISVWTGSEMIVWGGVNNGGLNTGGRYNPANGTWTPTAVGGAAPSGRWHHTLIWTGSEMIAWGGTADGAAGLGTGARLDPASDRWAPTSSFAGVLSARGRHTAVWTGSEMVVWGGTSSNGLFLGDGAKYHPATDAWTPTSIAGAPSGRAFHTAIWTGDETLVWGGLNSAFNNVSLNSGGRYNPASNTWAATNLNAAPVARHNHSAVWTGTTMTIWGGVQFGSNGLASALNDGSRYHPTSDAWAAISTVDAPVARSNHTAVWTGAEMIIWGGNSLQSTPLSSGGRYSPEFNGWAPTEQLNAPRARGTHTAVWDGSAMIVWGGTADFGSGLGTGGRYSFDSATNSWSWTPTALSGAPSPRFLHTAVWVGSEMIIWGGLHGDTRLNSGARYNPVSDNWRATPTNRAPVPRFAHTAVWTGSAMIVFGGCCYFDDYGILESAADPIFASGFEPGLLPRFRGHFH